MSRDGVGEFIRTRLAEGIEVTGEDFRGWDCDWCGETIPFVAVLRDRGAVVLWDVAVQDPDDPEPLGYCHRYYFCSERCAAEGKRYPNTMDARPDEVEERGAPVIAEDGDTR